MLRTEWSWLFRGGVLILLGLIAYTVAQPDGLERCMEQRYQQVLGAIASAMARSVMTSA